VDNQSNSQL